FVPEDKGRLVTAFLESFFRRYVEYDFTADLEEQLDEISAGHIGWKDVLRAFWRDFAAAVDATKDLRVSEVLDNLNELLGPYIFPQTADGSDPRACPACGEGKLSLKLGKFGAFIGCSNYPECRYTRQMADLDKEDAAAEGPKVLGLDPETGLEVSLRSGRFGPYVQLGEGDKPKRSSIPRDMPVDQVDLERALALLALPREVGVHPETGKPITTSIGRYGPYLAHDGKYVSLPSSEEMFTIGINRAVTLLAEGKKGGRAKAEALRELGVNPETDKPVKVMSGRYGPYVTDGATNATLPRDVTPETITLDAALALLAAKAAKGGKTTRAKATKTAKTSTAAKTKTATKSKAAAKPKTAKSGTAAKTKKAAATKASGA
ncbi:MAG TPA: topoisomerase C-terminal repeat-containing protein, partial [Sphingomonadales bacterium]